MNTTRCTHKNCNQRPHIGTDRCFDHLGPTRASKTGFGIGFTLVILLNLAILGLLGWALIELVQWVTSK